MFKVSVLASGAGSTFLNLLEHCRDGVLRNSAQITKLVVDRECGATEIARRWSIPTFVIQKRRYADLQTWSEDLFQQDADLHVMAGFLAKVIVPEHAEGKILNIHPSLLPEYGGKGMYGHHVHEAVLKDKKKITGCTVHVVDNEFDHGPILEQAVIPVNSSDVKDIEAAVKAQERLLYPLRHFELFDEESTTY